MAAPQTPQRQGGNFTWRLNAAVNVVVIIIHFAERLG